MILASLPFKGDLLGPNCPSKNTNFPPNMGFGANIYPEVTYLFCRLPLITLIRSIRGFLPRRPVAVMSTVIPMGTGPHGLQV